MTRYKESSDGFGNAGVTPAPEGSFVLYADLPDYADEVRQESADAVIAAFKVAFPEIADIKPPKWLMNAILKKEDPEEEDDYI